MTVFAKDPGALLDYTIDWAAQYLAGDALASSIWSVEPDETGGIQVASHGFDTSTTQVSLSAGIPGHIYRVTNRVTTSGGRTDERSLDIRVLER